MTMLAEDPKVVVFIGILAVAMLASILPRTQRYVLVFSGMAGVVLLTVAGVVVERLVVTEREQIEAVLDGIAAALEDNDLEALLQHVSPEAEKTRYRATLALEQVIVTDARVRNVEIVVNRLTSPVTAEIRFDGVVRYEFRGGTLGRDFYPAKFVVELRLEGDRWLVTDHIETQAQGL